LDNLYANPPRITMADRVIVRRALSAIIIYERNIYKGMLLRKISIKLLK
jgi:hypothetical protein